MLSRPRYHSVAGRIRSIEKSDDLVGNQTRDLLACSVLPQPTTLPRAPKITGGKKGKAIHVTGRGVP
jgi:hypothetical protein